MHTLQRKKKEEEKDIHQNRTEAIQNGTREKGKKKQQLYICFLNCPIFAKFFFLLSFQFSIYAHTTPYHVILTFFRHMNDVCA